MQICRCDRCGNDGATHLGCNYSHPGKAAPEPFSVDLCVKCADEILNPLREIVKRMRVAEYAAQVRT